MDAETVFSREWPKKYEYWACAGFFVAALAIRLIYLYQLKQNSPFFFFPPSDEGYYYQWAQDIAAGRGQGSGAFFRGPLYPYLLALVFKVFGPDLYVARLAQALIGSGSCLFTYLTAKRLFGPLTGLVAGLLFLVYGPFIFYDAALLMAQGLGFLLLALTLLLLELCDRWSEPKWLAAGMILGLSALARGSVLILLPAVGLWLVWSFSVSKRRLLGGLVLFCLGTALTILPVTVRNYLAGGGWVLISANGGINFYLGNNPGSQGMYMSLKDAGVTEAKDRGDTNLGMEEESRLIAGKMAGKVLSSAQASGFWFSRGLDFIRQQPLDWFKLLCLKGVLFFTGREVSNLISYSFGRRFSSLLSLPFMDFAHLMPLALTGMVLGLSKRRERLLLFLMAAGYSLSVILFFVATRYRIPVIPFFIIFAAYCLRRMTELVKSKKYAGLGGVFLLALSFACLVNIRPVLDDPVYMDFKLALAHRSNGDFEKAIGVFKKIKERSPRDVLTINELGLTYRQCGQEEEAIGEFEQALRTAPDHPLAYYNLGTVYARQMRYEKAAQAFKDALALYPEYPQAHHHLGLVYAAVGKDEKAAASFREALRLAPGFAEAYKNLGVSYARRGEYEKAAQVFKKALELDPADVLSLRFYQECLRNLKKIKQS